MERKKSVFAVIFVAVLMLTLAISAIVIATHEDEKMVTIAIGNGSYDPQQCGKTWDGIVSDMNQDGYSKQYNMTWVYDNNTGLKCTLPANSSTIVDDLRTFTYNKLSGFGTDAWAEPTETYALTDPVVKYLTWSISTSG